MSMEGNRNLLTVPYCSCLCFLLELRSGDAARYIPVLPESRLFIGTCLRLFQTWQCFFMPPWVIFGCTKNWWLSDELMGRWEIWKVNKKVVHRQYEVLVYVPARFIHETKISDCCEGVFKNVSKHLQVFSVSMTKVLQSGHFKFWTCCKRLCDKLSLKIYSSSDVGASQTCLKYFSV